jgi:hypothetical protein
VTKDAQLLAWAATHLQKEQVEKAYGTVTIRLEAGMITHVEVKRMHKPDTKPDKIQ